MSEPPYNCPAIAVVPGKTVKIGSTFPKKDWMPIARPVVLLTIKLGFPKVLCIEST